MTINIDLTPEVDLDHIKRARDGIMKKMGRNTQDLELMRTSLSRLKVIFDNIGAEKVAKLESAGIYVQELLNYDLDSLTGNKELIEEFHNTYAKVVREINSMVDRISGTI